VERGYLGVLLLVCFLACGAVARADLTLQGPSGFIQTPGGTTIKAKGIEWAWHTRSYRIPGTRDQRFLNHLAMGFSPLRDIEVGIAKAIDQRRGKEDFDPDPTVNLKARLPFMGEGFSQCAVGMLLDTNPNNYHTLYFTVGGCGVGWNFGGNPGSGVAAYGQYDRGRKRPKDVAFLLGGDLNPGPAGERGYRPHFLVDYNGDVISFGWRHKSHRGFWADIFFHTRSSYTDFYDYQPVILGVGAIF